MCLGNRFTFPLKIKVSGSKQAAVMRAARPKWRWLFPAISWSCPNAAFSENIVISAELKQRFSLISHTPLCHLQDVKVFLLNVIHRVTFCCSSALGTVCMINIVVQWVPDPFSQEEVSHWCQRLLNDCSLIPLLLSELNILIMMYLRHNAIPIVLLWDSNPPLGIL